jgi:putative ABC transport system substrate-binding protein
MRRRDFLGVLGGAAVAWPNMAGAQQSVPVVGFLDGTSAEAFAYAMPAFRQGLSETGYLEGRNVTILYRSAEDQNDRLPALAAELVGRGVAVIVTAGGTVSAIAAKAATRTTPVVFMTGVDPVRFGLVTSLNRPGGNVTGVSFLVNMLVPKRLELLNELVPRNELIGIFVDPNNPNKETDTNSARVAADAIGKKIYVLDVSSESDIESAFAALARRNTDALFVAPHAVFNSRRDQLVTLAARHRIPTIYTSRAFTMAGGLISYGTNFLDSYRQAGIYAGRVLKGDKPGDLPVMQSTKFELVINLKTAKSYGIEISAKLLALADEVIE